MFDMLKWKVIHLLIKWNVLAVVPVKANRGYDAGRYYKR